MAKGENTRLTILENGVDMASQLGLESVTIGALADAIGISKSGLFAHFQSKENLQIEILKFAEQEFAESVVVPALKTRGGIPRIKALVRNWIGWGAKLTGGCIFVTAGTEFSDRPGRVRDYLLHQQQRWIDTLRRIAESAVRAGDFRSDADCRQFAFDLYSLILGFHFYHRLLRDSQSMQRQQAALDKLLANYR